MQDSEGAIEDTNARLIQQFVILSDLLSDQAPAIRVKAIRGVCRILNLYWEIVPSATTAAYITRLTGANVILLYLPDISMAYASVRILC